MSAHPYDRPKRVIDIVVGLTALIASAPVQGIVALLVRGDLGSPVLFRQERPGKDEQIFELVKFRTMLEPDEDAGLVTDEQRLTRFGAFLRSTSLDELPSLWNVIKGDLSLVGPRPLLVQYLSLYSSWQHRRHEVRPGLTGLSQVSGRNALNWEDRLELDVEYVEKRSLSLDLEIIAITFKRLINRDGISHQGSATMPVFTGNQAAADA